MKYTICGFQQKALLEKYNCDDKDAFIIRWFVDFSNSRKMSFKIIDGKIFYWFCYSAIINDMPILKISNKQTIARKMKRMCETGIFEMKIIQEENNKTYFHIKHEALSNLLGDNNDKIIDPDNGKYGQNNQEGIDKKVNRYGYKNQEVLTKKSKHNYSTNYHSTKYSSISHQSKNNKQKIKISKDQEKFQNEYKKILIQNNFSEDDIENINYLLLKIKTDIDIKSFYLTLDKMKQVENIKNKSAYFTRVFVNNVKELMKIREEETIKQKQINNKKDKIKKLQVQLKQKKKELSKCPKCNGTGFEIINQSHIEEYYKQYNKFIKTGNYFAAKKLYKPQIGKKMKCECNYTKLFDDIENIKNKIANLKGEKIYNC